MTAMKPDPALRALEQAYTSGEITYKEYRTQVLRVIADRLETATRASPVVVFRPRFRKERERSR